MVPVSTEFQNLIQQPSRSIRAKVLIRSTEFDEESIIDFKVVETVNPGDSFQIGTAASSKLEITLVDTGEILLDGAEVKPYIGLEVGGSIQWVPMGVYVVDDIRIDKHKVELTCFDYMVKLEKPYFSELTYPATLHSVAAEIAQKAGVTFASTLPSTQVPELSGYTLREAIGYVAGFIGGFARFNRLGELEVKTYPQSGFNQAITADHYKDFESAEGPFAVGRLTCIAGEDEEGERIVLTSGSSGVEVQFENPLMTQEQLDSLLALMGDLNYWPVKLSWQGNPALEAGDSVSVSDTEENFYYTFVMEQEIRFGGGLSASLEAPGKIESAQEFQSAGPLTRTMTRYAAEQALIKHLMADKASIGELEAVEARIDNLVVDTAQIEDLAVTSAKIADLSVTNAKIGNLAVDSAKIADAAIVNAKIANLSVSSAKIQDAAILNAKIADAAISNAKIQDATITGAKIGSATIQTANIALGAITSALIEQGAIGAAQIADASITDAKIVELTANKITAGTLAVERLQITGPDSILYEINVNSVGELSASEYTLDGEGITERSITADRIVAGSITGAEIAAETILANNIAANAITAGKIEAGSINTAHITATGLDAAVIKTGTLDAGRIRVGPQTTYDSGYDPSLKETPEGAQAKADEAEKTSAGTGFHVIADGPEIPEYTGFDGSGYGIYIEVDENIHIGRVSMYSDADNNSSTIILRRMDTLQIVMSKGVTLNAGLNIISLDFLLKADISNGVYWLGNNGAWTNGSVRRSLSGVNLPTDSGTFRITQTGSMSTTFTNRNYWFYDIEISGVGVKGDIPEGTIAGKAVSDLETGSGAQSKADSAEATAKNYADTKIADLEASLGDMAFEDAVEFAMLGSTIIDGGYIKTGLIDASRIDTGVLNAARIRIGSGSTFDSGYDPTTKETPDGAQAKADAAESSAKSYSDTKVSDLQSSLGDLAYEDVVEIAKLGTTIIDGGYLKTDLIEAGSLVWDKSQGGTLRIGGLNDQYGTMEILDADGDVVGSWTATGPSMSEIDVPNLRIAGARFFKTNLDDYFVNASTGNDSYNGKSATVDGGGVGPFRTIQRAVMEAGRIHTVNGNVFIRIAAGTYNEKVDVLGVFGTNMIIQGASTATTTVVGGFAFRSSAGLELQNLTIDAIDGEPLAAYSVTGLYITGVRVNGNNITGTAGLLARFGSSVYVTGCFFSNCQVAGVYLRGGSFASVNARGSNNGRGIYLLEGSIMTGVTYAPNGTTPETASGGSVVLSKGTHTNDPSVPATYTPPTTTQWTANQIGAWRSVDGWRTDYMMQGYYSGGLAYPYKGYAGFDDAAIRSALSGKTIENIRIKIKRRAAGGNSGARNLYFYSHNHASRPAGEPTLATNRGLDGSALGTLSWGEEKWITLPIAFGNALRDNTAKGIALYINGSNDYMYIDGDPVLEITYK